MKLTSEAVSGVRWTSFSSVVNVGTDTLRSVILARYLSPVDFGLMAMVLVAVGFIQTYRDLGISAAIIHRQDATREQLSSLYWLNIFSGLATFGVAWLCLPLVPILFREPRLLPLLKVVTLIFLIIPLGNQFEILLQRDLRFRTLVNQEILASVGSLIVAVACAAYGLGVWTLVLSFLTNATLKTGMLLSVGLSQYRPSLHFRKDDLQGFVGFGLYQMGERSINYFSERLDQILIGPILGAQALGFYTFAFNLTSQPTSRINPIVTRVAFPVFSKVQNDTDKLRRGYIKLISLLTTVNAPLLIGLAAVAPLAVPMIFGAKWAASVILVQFLCLVNLARSVGNPIGALQLAKGRADLGFWWNLMLMAVSVPAIYMGGRLDGATGVALALLGVQLVLTVPSYWLLIRPLIGKCGMRYLEAALGPIAIASVMGLLVMALPLLYHPPRVIQLIIQIGLGAILYVTLLYARRREAVADVRSALFSH